MTPVTKGQKESGVAVFDIPALQWVGEDCLVTDALKHMKDNERSGAAHSHKLLYAGLNLQAGPVYLFNVRAKSHVVALMITVKLFRQCLNRDFIRKIKHQAALKHDFFVQ